jgi:hypothetical protein
LSHSDMALEEGLWACPCPRVTWARTTSMNREWMHTVLLCPTECPSGNCSAGLKFKLVWIIHIFF